MFLFLWHYLTPFRPIRVSWSVVVVFLIPCLSCPVSLHFLSLWLAALALIVSSCVSASPALIVSTCVLSNHLPVYVNPVSLSPVTVRTVYFVFDLFWSKDEMFCGALLSSGSYLSLATQPCWQSHTACTECVCSYSLYLFRKPFACGVRPLWDDIANTFTDMMGPQVREEDLALASRGTPRRFNPRPQLRVLPLVRSVCTGDN